MEGRFVIDTDLYLAAMRDEQGGPIREYLRMHEPTMLHSRAVATGCPLGALGGNHRPTRTHLYVHRDALARHIPAETLGRYGGVDKMLALTSHLNLTKQPERVRAIDAGEIDAAGWFEVWPSLFGGLRIDTQALGAEWTAWFYDHPRRVG